MEWKDISVFISSTFNDMHAERDYVLKNVFPQLGEWCERRHIFFRDIDLRWGVTPQDSRTQNTIYKCLTAVDSCRPFFLCFLGQRRGWVPPLEKINQRTRDTFPEIVEMARTESCSATEYEIEHALLMPLAYFEEGALHRSEPVKNALFLRRRPEYLKALSPMQKRVFLDYDRDKCATPEGYAEYLRFCREANETTYRRIGEKNLVLDYDCRWDATVLSPELSTEDPEDDRARGRLTDFTIRASDLPESLRTELLHLLKKEFPEETPTGDIWPLKAYLLAAYVKQLMPYTDAGEETDDRYARDREQQRVFANLSLRDTVPRRQELDRLNAYCESDLRCPLLILADSGMGKTTLSAQFIKQREEAVLYRFLGVSELSGDLLPLWESILVEAGLPAPSDMDELLARLPSLLARMAPRILLLDGLEQISGGLQLLEMIPAPLPAGIKVVLSIRSDHRRKELGRFLSFHADYPTVLLTSFQTEQKEQLVQSNLRTSLKELSPELMNLVCGLNESGNPLYLSILLADIRVFSSSSRLQKEIERHGSSPLSAFDAMLDRMERDKMFDMLSPSSCVPLIFGLLACARDGLSYEELTDCLSEYFPEESREACAGSLQICLRQVRTFLARRDGRTDFRHQAFQVAAKQRYHSREMEFHAALARLFRAKCDPNADGSFIRRDQRALREYAWHLSFVSKTEAEQLYGNICWLNARCEGNYVRDVIREMAHPGLAGKKAIRELLVRFRESLESVPNILPSLLWTYGIECEKTGYEQLCCPWIQLKGVNSEPKETETKEIGTLKILGEIRYSTAAFSLAGDTSFAFAFTAQGQITAYELLGMLPLDTPLYTAKAMPLGLCASNHLLAAAFENEKIELYAWETEGKALRSRPLASLDYLPPLYSGAALCFDSRDCLWFQPEEAVLASYDPGTQKQTNYSIPEAEEISSLATVGETIYGTACVGQNTLLFCLDASGKVRTRDLGSGDSRVLCAQENGCLVSCAASGDAYPLQIVNHQLETIEESRLESPVTAALPLGSSWLLLPAKQALGELWLWENKNCRSIRQQLLYQDQAQLGQLKDGSMVMLSAGTILRFEFVWGGSGATRGQRTKEEHWQEMPDPRRYELTNTKLYENGNYACISGVSVSMRSVRDEQAAGAVFLRKISGHWQVLGDTTWSRSLELIRTVCIDPESGRFTLLFRSETSIHWVTALQGTAEELCMNRGTAQELRLPQNKENCGCFAGGRLFFGAGELLSVYDARTLCYETASLLPAPITDITSEGDGVSVQFGNQTMSVEIQEGVIR